MNPNTPTSIIDPNVYLLAALVGGVVLIAFFVSRFLFDWVASPMNKRLNGVHDDSTSLVEMVRQGKQGKGTKMDVAFQSMVQRTGTGMDDTQAVGWILFCGVGLGAILYLLREEIYMALLGFFIGAGIIMFTLIAMQNRYRQQLQELLPDAFYLLARSLRAGLSLDQSLELVGKQGIKPLSTEFQRCNGQIKLGIPIPTALEMMAKRVPLLDFNVFVSTVSIYTKTGGNLPLLIDRLATGARDRNQFRGHLKTATALGRTTAFAIALAAPLFVLAYYLIQPDFGMPFFNSVPGWIALGIAFFLEIIGVIWLYQLLKVEY